MADGRLSLKTAFLVFAIVVVLCMWMWQPNGALSGHTFRGQSASGDSERLDRINNDSLYSKPAGGKGEVITESQPLNLTAGPNKEEVTASSKPPTATNTSTTNKQQRGYLVINSFTAQSQQAVGLRTLMSAQCWIGSFGLPMYVVEPFIENSIVHTRAQPQRNTKLLSLSDFYNMEHYNVVSKQQGMTELTTWGDFIDNAPRQVIFITLGSSPQQCKCLLSKHTVKSKTPKVTWKSSKSEKCSSFPKPGPLRTLTTAHDFCVVKIVSIFPTPIICSEKEMHEIIFGSLKPGNVSIVIGYWCPGMYVPNAAKSDPAVCQRACSEGLENKYLPSTQLLSNIQTYESNDPSDQGSLGVKLAVMLRTEHVVFPLNAKLRPIGVKLCLAKTAGVVRNLQSKLGVKQPFVAIDIGKYGSGSWNEVLRADEKHLINDMKSTLLSFFNHSLTFEEWEDTFTEVSGGITDRGYIAALQQGIASRADCIVFLGGGNFLRLALHEYLNLHPEVSSWCIYFVCIEERFKAEYDVSLDRRSGHKAKPQWELLPENKELKLYVGDLDFTGSQHD